MPPPRLDFDAIPLCERQEEAEQLRAVLSQERPAVIRLQGAAGTGKSLLVRSVYDDDPKATRNESENESSHTMANDNCWFVQGKFDDGQQAVKPLAAIAEALDAIAARLLVIVSETNDTTTGGDKEEDKNNNPKRIWKNRIQDAFDELEVPPIPSALMPRLAELMMADEQEQEKNETEPECASAKNDHASTTTEIQTKQNRDRSQDLIAKESGGDYGRNGFGFERLKLSFRAFLFTVAQYVFSDSSSSALVVFLDDLQWASDTARLVILDWVQALQQENVKNNTISTRLVLVLAHRPVQEYPGLNDFCQQLERAQQQQTVHHLAITISNLTLDAVTGLLQTLLHRDKEEIRQLADIVCRKTGGNAFFVVQFLRLLESQAFLSYSTTDLCWEWDIPSIRKQTDIIASNVVDIMASKIKQTPRAMQTVLMTAACFGLTHFDSRLVFSILKDVLNQKNNNGNDENSTQHVDPQWEEILRLDGIPPMEEAKQQQLMQQSVEQGILDHLNGFEYKFAHDRIREGAFALLPEGPTKKRFQLLLGRRLRDLLKDGTAFADQQSLLSLAIPQLNAGLDLIADETERTELATLNYKAALVAISASSFHPAAELLATAVKILGASPWETHHDSMMKISIARIRMEFCCGRLAESVLLAGEVLGNATDFHEKNIAYQTIVLCQIQQQQPDKAFASLFGVLAELNAPIPRSTLTFHIVRQLLWTQRTLKNLSDDDIVALPQATDRDVDYQMGFLERLMELCFFHDQNLIPLVILQMIRTTLQKGHNMLSARSFSFYGWFCARMGNYDDASRFGQVALRIADKLPANHPDQRAVVICYHFCFHWRRSFQDALEPLLRVNKVMFENGNLEYVMMDFIAYFYGYFCSGLQLSALEPDNRKYFNLLKEFNQLTHLDHNCQFFQAVSNLTGSCLNRTLLTGDFMDEQECTKRWTTEKNIAALHHMNFYSMMLGIFFCDFELAEKRAAKLLPMSEEPGDERFTIRFFFEGMIALIVRQQRHRGRCSKIRSSRHSWRGGQKNWKKALKMIRLFEKWVGGGAPYAYPLLVLLQAEQKAALSDGLDFEEVRSAFDKAVSAAARVGMLHVRALANERAGNYCMACRDDEWATTYLSSAREAYIEWGAMAKVDHMETFYKDKLERSDRSNLNTKISTSLRARERLNYVSTKAHRQMRSSRIA